MRTFDILLKVLHQRNVKRLGLRFTAEVGAHSFVNFWFGDGVLKGELERNAWYLYCYGSPLCRSKADVVVILECGDKVYLYKIEN